MSYFILKEDGEFVLCELRKNPLNETEGVFIPNLAYGETLEDLQKECDLIFEENVINVNELEIIENKGD